MLEMFTTREIALGIYLLLFIIYIFTSKRIRSYAINLVRVALCKQLVVPFCVILIYAIIFIFVASKVSFWNYQYIKDVLLWVVFVGVPMCYKAVDKDIDNRYFRRSIFENFKFIAIVEFFISSFTFSLWIELLLQIVLLFVFMLQAIAGRKEEYKSAKKLIDVIVTVISLYIIVSTLKIALKTYAEHSISEYIISFIIPIILSFIYVPVAYIMAIYSRYETLFMRMKFKEPNIKKIIRTHRLAVIKKCLLSIKCINKFERVYMPKMYVNMRQEEFEKILCDFKNDV